ncbi:hypothetical protein [Actinokineospora xionganensis]|uniref:Uncharacterized protein n=1 Tax=Actinokineospora xionganensis TaxID=2684470 RepID=A0ABR7L7M7_9PSEU|nr:hypothetical protein [Actinokineospora xionganensis]MBC6448644.1 hypothetical protein [Actinokineospora xionganensis]
MLSLKTEGFVGLVADVADRARLASDGSKLVRIALTLDDRLDERVGLLAVTSADRIVLDLVRAGSVAVAVGENGPDRLVLTGSGRVAVRLDGAEEPADLHPLGALRWGALDAPAVKAAAQVQAQAVAASVAAVHRQLAALPREEVLERVDRIEYCLVHMAPVLIHVNDRVYTNLGKRGTLPGKSMGIGDENSLFNRLRGVPVAEWAPEDACFVACLAAVLQSGPPVRAEEFNGAQLLPSLVDAFLRARIEAYGCAAPAAPAADLTELESRARECAGSRQDAIAQGKRPYRVINGLTLHKVEHLMDTPALLADLPDRLRAHLADLLRDPLPERIDALGPLWSDFAASLVGAPTVEPFGTALECALHGLLTATAEAFDADVSMSRGPQRFDPLRVDHGDVDPLGLGTGAFYCCVTPRKAFVDRFGQDRAGLAKALAAYSARMRFNTWHYLPHTLGIVEREPGRDDWFFAPTMPDVTEWSDQHHTGHVVFGVRYAIRAPFGITYDGRALPGLYDLRLMRTTAPAFTVADLRGAIAAADVLRGLYQAMARYEPIVTDFGKDWYQRVHG